MNTRKIKAHNNYYPTMPLHPPLTIHRLPDCAIPKAV